MSRSKSGAVECGGEASWVEREDKEWVSTGSRRHRNPICEEMRATKQHKRRTTSHHTRQMDFSLYIFIVESCQDRSTALFRCRKRQIKTSRTRKATKIKDAALLVLLLICQLSHYSTSSSIAPILHNGYHTNTKRRKNNTGFYYGIRDEHILCSSTSPSRTLSSLRPSLSWKPAVVDELTSKLQNLPYQISLLARERMEWIQDIRQQNNYYKTASRNSLQKAENASEEIHPSQCRRQQMEISKMEPPKGLPTLLLQKLDWRLSAELRESLLQKLSQSMQSIRTSQQWNQELHELANTLNNKECNTILHKAMSILGGSMSSQHYRQYDQHDQENNDIAVIIAASTTKSKRKKKKRQNNTGFYYGIREDVLMLPDNGRKEKEKSTIITNEKIALLPLRQKEKRKSSSPQEREEQRNNNKIQKKEKRQLPPKLNTNKQKRPTSSRGDVSSEMSNILGETMLELREMREEIISLREELRAVKTKLREEEEEERRRREREKSPSGWASDGEEEDINVEGFVEDEVKQESPEKAKRSRKRDFDRISKEVEQWAVKLLFEEERTGNGWKEISCNNMMRKKFNKDGRTQVYLKWMADSRDEQDRESDISDKNNLDYPCIKCYSTIDAPMETVCSFLSNEETIPIYNELVVDHDDVEEITPHSKITWTKMPKVLFVKSRDFVTFCSHRWWRDGTQVIVNQACEHEDRPGVMEEGQGDATRGFALRGANCEYSLRPKIAT